MTQAVESSTPAHRDRLCAFRGCRAALPPSTGRPGNRPKYCQDGKTWGPSALTCKAAEAAHLAVESLRGEDPIPPVGAAELRELLDDATGPLQTVLDAVLATRTQLDQDVLTAFAERDTALEAAAADRGAREHAEQDAAHAEAAVTEAHRQVRDAEDLRAAAVRGRDAADARARDADRAQMRAQGQQAALEDRLHRADELATAATDRAGQLQSDLAEQIATVRVTDQALQAEKARSYELAETHRAELAARETTAAAMRAEHDEQLGRLRDTHAAELARLAAQHVAALDAARSGHIVALEQVAARHADQVGGLQRQLGAAEHGRDRALHVLQRHHDDNAAADPDRQARGQQSRG